MVDGNGHREAVQMLNLTFEYLTSGHKQKNLIKTVFTLKNGYLS